MEAREREFRNQNNPSLDSSNNTRNEAPDRRRNHFHGVPLRQEQTEPHRERRESNPDPDPAQPAPATQPPPSPVRYRECLKNHAAGMGAHVVDGCGEFMANGEEGTPESLNCAACECHRSFHRRGVAVAGAGEMRIAALHNPPPRATTMQQQHHMYHHLHHQLPPIMVAFGGAPAESSGEDPDVFPANAGQPSRKRFRTKFTDEQKEKMHDFAERIGWRIQKQDEQEIREFCNEVGLKKQVFKVWMHNSKQAMKKKQLW